MQTDVAGMNFASVGGAGCFITPIGKAPGRLGACHMETEGKAAELLKCHIR